jgi:hypothetical protein
MSERRRIWSNLKYDNRGNEDPFDGEKSVQLSKEKLESAESEQVCTTCGGLALGDPIARAWGKNSVTYHTIQHHAAPRIG